MNWRKWLQMTAWRWRGMSTAKYYDQFRSEYGLDTPTMRRLQSSLVRDLLQHASSNVPYYSAFTLPESGELLPSLRSFPILTKEIIRQQGEQLLAKNRNHSQCYTNTSGGSTGEPIQITQDQNYSAANFAAVLVIEEQLGFETGQKRVLLWGSERDIFTGSMGLKAKVGQWLTQTIYLNAFRMTPENMRNYLATINRYQPRLIVAYAQAIYELACFAESEKIAVAPQPAIVTSAGTLYPFMRDKLTQVFGCPGRVFNRYGSREVGLIACEQPQQSGLTTAWMANYVEILDDNDQPVPAGTEGRIIVTSLLNLAMPLIRYDIGDRGALLPDHEVQHGTQVLTRIAGRNVDAFKSADGALIDGEYFTHLLYFRPWVKKFQVVQHAQYDVTYSIVLQDSQSPPATDLQEIIDKTRLVLGSHIQVQFQYVPEILPGKSGKYRYTISEA